MCTAANGEGSGARRFPIVGVGMYVGASTSGEEIREVTFVATKA